MYKLITGLIMLITCFASAELMAGGCCKPNCCPKPRIDRCNPCNSSCRPNMPRCPKVVKQSCAPKHCKVIQRHIYHPTHFYYQTHHHYPTFHHYKDVHHEPKECVKREEKCVQDGGCPPVQKCPKPQKGCCK